MYASGSARPRESFWLLTALVLTAAIPVLLLGGWMAYITADQERSYARKAATEALTQVAHRIEGEISRELQVPRRLQIRSRSTGGTCWISISKQRGSWLPARCGRPPH